MDDHWSFLLIGGIGFFFLGMKTLSESLKKIAGERMKAILHMVTKLPIVGVLVGALVTCLIQSSSATTVMVVGFVNAGLLALKQAISVIMGANIGTTLTAWLVSSMSVLKITHYALPAVGIGFLISTFGKTTKTRAWGDVLIGFGILFIGLDLMKDAFNPLRDSAYVKSLFVKFSDNPLLGVLVGTIMTILLQSSSATIAIVQVLAFNGLINFEAAVPLILGDNIGTTITAQLAAAAGTNLNARRAAMSHTIFNVFGVAYMLFFVYTGWFVKAVDFIIPGEITTKNIMFHIAVAHSSFNVVNVLVFLPFIHLLEKASIFLVPKRKGTVDLGPQYLEKHLLKTPPLAMEQAKKECVYMLKVASKAVRAATESFLEGDIKKVEAAVQYETATDNLQSEITQYLVDLSQREILEDDSESIPVLIHNVNDLERVGDHSQNIAELARRKTEEKLPFSDEAVKDIRQMEGEISKMFEEANLALGSGNMEAAQSMLKREQAINELHDAFKTAHIRRLNQRSCRLDSGFIFLEFMDNMEKIGDRLTNIAQGVIGKMKWKVEQQEVNV